MPAKAHASVAAPVTTNGAWWSPWFEPTYWAPTSAASGRPRSRHKAIRRSRSPRRSTFGRYGIEIDARTAASPPGTELLAEIPGLVAGRSAEMTYYETPSGAKVFDAGALDFAASLDQPAVSRLVDNLWSRLT